MSSIGVYRYKDETIIAEDKQEAYAILKEKYNDVIYEEIKLTNLVDYD